MLDTRNPNITDADTLIVALDALDAGDTSAVPVWQELQLSEEQYWQACRWLKWHLLPPAESLRRIQTIAPNDLHCKITLRLPLAQHRAFVSRVNEAIRERLSAFNPAVARQTAFFPDFAVTTEPGFGVVTRVDACCHLFQLNVIPLALAVVEAGDNDQLQDLRQRVFARDTKVRMLVVFKLQKQGEGKYAMVEQYLRTAGSVQGTLVQVEEEEQLVFRNPDGMLPLEGGTGSGKVLAIPTILFYSDRAPSVTDLPEWWKEHWYNKIEIPLGVLYQMLREEEAKLKRSVFKDDRSERSGETVDSENFEDA